MLGIELNGACFLCGAMTLAGVSTATALMVDVAVVIVEIDCEALTCSSCRNKSFLMNG